MGYNRIKSGGRIGGYRDVLQPRAALLGLFGKAHPCLCVLRTFRKAPFCLKFFSLKLFLWLGPCLKLESSELSLSANWILQVAKERLV